MPSPVRSRPVLDVDGEMTYLAWALGHAGAVEQRSFHLRCYADGWTTVEAAGVVYPVPPDMTVWEYFQWIFAASTGIERAASGE